jgi:2-(1,2-epoxy-1,2-dihydrophenyl)acetyl-CoA isomerase
MDQIQYEVSERIARLRINRPEARNACTVAMLMHIQDRIYEAETDPDVHTLLITGNGDNLTAGFDLKEVPANRDRVAVQRHFRKASLYWHSIMHSLVRLRKPVVVGAHGLNVGGAIGLIAAADLAVMADDCRVSPAWMSIGLGPDASSTYHLPRIVGLRRAIEWIMTNHVATAQEMLAWGFVTRVVPRAELEATVWKVAKDLTQVPAELLGETKFLMHHGTTAPIENQTEWEREGVLLGTRTEYFLDRLQEFLDKQRPSIREVEK